MKFIVQFGGDLKAGKQAEFQQWIQANEKEYANAMPEGAKYLGTYFGIYQSDKKAGSVHTFIELDSYGAQDALAEAGKGDGIYAQLTREATAFFDFESDNWTNSLYKKVADATIWGDD